ncbi:MAG: site-2 protease family protein [Clostridia bacterium]|nr:site-2 protease family protein [Clostridia bacterium]
MNKVLAIDFAAFGQWIGGILLAVLILLAMITIHEFGHYLSGKLLNFRITEFSIGFGPAIFKKRSKKTGELFAVRIIPLGGYCAFDGEDYEEDDLPEGESAQTVQAPFTELLEGEEGAKDPTVSATSPAPTQEEEYPQPKGERFNDQAPWKRIIVLVSGALMNYLLALVLLLIMCFSYGVPMCITVPVGYKGEKLTPTAWETPTVEALDILVSIEGREIDMYTDCMDALAGKKAGDTVSVVVYRLYEETVDGNTVRGWREKEVLLTLLTDGDFSSSADMEKLEKTIGLSIATQSVRRDFWHTVGGAFEYSGEMATSVLRTLGELITGAFGDKTADVVGGPISMIGQTAQIASASPFSFLYVASFIGVNLAVFNLLPVPALDGCKVIFCIIEWIRKKPVNRKVEAIINFAGIVLLFGFAILIDLLKLF